MLMLTWFAASNTFGDSHCVTEAFILAEKFALFATPSARQMTKKVSISYSMFQGTWENSRVISSRLI